MDIILRLADRDAPSKNFHMKKELKKANYLLRTK